jgi:NitT/TauT family transport system ATP-binding protein
VIFVTHDIAEAVYLGDEIHIMRANPARIVKRIAVGLPGNRTREIKRSQEFTDIVRSVEDAMIDVELAMQAEEMAAAAAS